MKQQRGLSLLTTVFLLLLLSLVAVQVIRLGTVQQSTDALAIGGIRVHYAARSALEWAMGWVEREGAGWSCPSQKPPHPVRFGRPGLRYYQASVTIHCTTHQDGNGNSVKVFWVRSEAELGTPDDPLYVRRQLEDWTMR